MILPTSREEDKLRVGSTTTGTGRTHSGSSRVTVPRSQMSASVAPPNRASSLTSTANARSFSRACSDAASLRKGHNQDQGQLQAWVEATGRDMVTLRAEMEETNLHLCLRSLSTLAWTAPAAISEQHGTVFKQAGLALGTILPEMRYVFARNNAKYSQA